jgi:hypothetical protein
MNDLRKAAEMVLQALESLNCGDSYKTHNTESVLRKALNETPPCKTDPNAPHGFARNASHSADRYVCECEGWEPPKREWVGLTEQDLKPLCDVYKSIFDGYMYDFSAAIEAKLKEKNT